MLGYIAKRILLMPVMLFMVTLVIFTLVNAQPVDPGAAILGQAGTVEAIAQLNSELGYDRPFLYRYGKFVLDAFKGDFGYSYYSRHNVLQEVVARLPNTVTLAGGTIIIAILFGLPLGLTCAVKQYSWADNMLSTLAMFAGAMPAFWLSLLLLLLFSLKLGWFPSSGVNQGPISWVLPMGTLSVCYISVFLRYSRSSMLDCIRQDYVTTARSKGCRESVVISRHALKNALMPLITITGVFFGSLLSSAVVVENVFSIPGLGLLVLDSIKRKDIPLVMGCIVFLAIIFLVITLLMDIAYALVDPRIKAMYSTQNKKRKKKRPAAAANSSAEV